MQERSRKWYQIVDRIKKNGRYVNTKRLAEAEEKLRAAVTISAPGWRTQLIVLCVHATYINRKEKMEVW